jgi:hypothetical protein
MVDLEGIEPSSPLSENCMLSVAPQIQNLSSGVVHPNVSATISTVYVAITPHHIVIPYFVFLTATFRARFVVVDYVSNASIVHDVFPSKNLTLA